MNIDTAIFMQNEKIRRFPNSIEAKKAKFYDDNGYLINKLMDIKHWNTFAASLIEQYNSKGTLSEGQIFSASAMIMKIDNNAEERAAKSAEQKKNMISIDISKILAILDKTEGLERRYSNGREFVTKKVQFPKVRVGDLVFSKASDSSKNAGAVYIKYQKEYIGKVLGGYYLPVNSPCDEVISEIKKICKDPLDSAIAYGKRTGNCAVCSRDLTRHDSIDRGIGPICAERLGIL
jgi:hypothetical protein|tara:strand:+ start:25 stop:726 length:702 start_codon:yes stop_codon:yes gene_type:complete